jgi:ADP-heptose:LPS heptosyltransferase
MRILFIAPTRVGDAVLSTGLLGWLSRTYPQARITVACGQGAAQLFEAHPQLEALIPLKKQRKLGHWRKLWRRVGFTRWHTVVDMRRSAMPWLVWARHRAVAPKGVPGEHRAVTMARTLKLDPAPEPTVWTSAEDRRRADDLLGGRRPVLALAPTANWRAKIWPADHFAGLVARLTGPGGPLEDALVLVTGGPGEDDQAQPVIDAVPEHLRVSAVGLDLRATAAVFARSRLFVGNDSGLMHLAAAAGTPTLGLFGPTDDTLYAPWSAWSQVVRTPESVAEITSQPGFHHKTAGTQMTSLTLDTVDRAARALLARTEDAPANSARSAAGRL